MYEIGVRVLVRIFRILRKFRSQTNSRNSKKSKKSNLLIDRSCIDNQFIEQQHAFSCGLSADTLSNTLNCPQKSIPKAFLPENQ